MLRDKEIAREFRDVENVPRKIVLKTEQTNTEETWQLQKETITNAGSKTWVKTN